MVKKQKELKEIRNKKVVLLTKKNSEEVVLPVILDIIDRLSLKDHLDKFPSIPCKDGYFIQSSGHLPKISL